MTDPTKFAFFKGINTPAVNGVLSATVTGGLPAGTYKLSTINSAATHQPIVSNREMGGLVAARINHGTPEVPRD